MTTSSVIKRIASLDWSCLTGQLEERGYCRTGALLAPNQCAALIKAYDDQSLYRSQVVMARHNYGRGEYKYFDNPLPPLVNALRETFYPHLVPVANRWVDGMGLELRYPLALSEFLELCHQGGQCRPTPLILRYSVGDFNCLHQDLYGERHFPLQLAIQLNQPQVDFEGGEFVLTEQRPRMQARVQVVPMAQGEGVIFAVNQRPVRGTRGYYRVKLRHGVSEVRCGLRHTLGVIFHDAS